MEESEVRIVDHKELTQFSSKHFYNSIFRFLEDFDQKESIDILKTLLSIAKSYQKNESFDSCYEVYRERFLEKYINRTKNAHSMGFINYLYIEGIWWRYKSYLFEKEKKYTYELVNYDTYVQESYLSGLITTLDTLLDTILVDFDNYKIISSNIINKDLTTSTSENLFNHISSIIFPSQIICALFYEYLQKAKIIPFFDLIKIDTGKNIKDIYNIIGQKHGNMSGEHFGKKYNLIHNDTDRLSFKRDILDVIPLLEKYPAAQKIAIEESKK